MINTVVLNGRLTRDPELRYTQNKTATASFSLAVDRTFKNANGEREADFINCVLWRKAAETFCAYARKGSLVGVRGRLQTRTYTGKQGQTVYVTEVIVDDFDFLANYGNGQQGQQRGNYQPQRQGGYNQQQAQPAQPVQNGYQPAPQTGVQDEDLPF